MGLGSPIFTIPPSELQDILRASCRLIPPGPASPLTIAQAVYIGTSTYPLSNTFIKIALLLQYHRVFNGRRVRMLCKCMLVITVVSGVTFALCSWFSCVPVAAFWDNTIEGGHCWGFASRDQLEFMRINVTQVVINVVLDLIVLLIPSCLYFQKDTFRSARLSLLGLFVLGLAYVEFFVCCSWTSS